MRPFLCQKGGTWAGKNIETVEGRNTAGQDETEGGRNLMKM